MNNKYEIYIDVCKKQFKLISISIVLLILEAIITMRLPFIMQDMNDALFNITNQNYSIFFKSLSIYSGFFLCRLILNYLSSIFFKIIGNNNTKDISNRIMRKIYYAIKKEPDQFSISNALQTLNNDSGNLGENGITNIYEIVSTSINIIAVFYYMWNADYKMSVIVTFTFLVLMFIQKFINSKIDNKIDEIKEAAGKYSYESNGIVNNFIAYRRIKCFHYISNRYNEKLENFINKSFELEKIICINSLASGLGALLNIMIIFFIGSISIIYGQMSISSLVTFNMYASNFGSYIISIPNLIVKIKSFNISYKRVMKILNVESYMDMQLNSDINMKLIDKIDLHNICFSYRQNQHNIINKLNAKFEKGRINCIKGSNGTGKSTLLNIITGEYAINSGEIKINNQELDLLPVKLYLDKHITYFSSNCVLFHDTIMNNFLLGNRCNYDIDMINEFCNITNINEWIEAQDSEYDTKIDELNQNLSDGQKQKLSLVRSLLDNKEVLIFDELEKHIDVGTKKNIMNYLNKIKNDKIIIIVSHDEYIQSKCDNILNLSC